MGKHWPWGRTSSAGSSHSILRPTLWQTWQSYPQTSAARGPGGSQQLASAYEMDLRHGHIMLRGRESEAASVVWGRLHQNLDRFAVIGEFKGKLPNSGATKDILERLFMGVCLYLMDHRWFAQLSSQESSKGEVKVRWQVVHDLMAAGSSGCCGARTGVFVPYLWFCAVCTEGG